MSAHPYNRTEAAIRRHRTIAAKKQAPKPVTSLAPWTVKRDTVRECYAVKDANGYDVVLTLTDYTTDYANAHLIADAPKMRTLLQKCVSLLEVAEMGGLSLYGSPVTKSARELLKSIEAEA